MTQTSAKLFANWAIQILPYIEEQALYDSFTLYDEVPGTTLGDFVNKKARGTEIQYMLCPTDMGRATFCSKSGGNWARGNYGLNVGLGFLWDHLDAAKDPWKRRCGRGIASVNRGATMSQIEDGTSKTILFGELRIGLSERDRRGTWAMPMVGSNLIAETASNFGGPPNDCQLGNDDITDRAEIEADVGLPQLQAECMTMGWDNSVSVTIRSRHPGGAHVALADGSVRFISDDIQSSVLGPGYNDPATGACPTGEAAFGVWQRLNSANDGFSVDGSAY
jgi:prepilin-type processing-associated H-X9-DG protein